MTREEALKKIQIYDFSLDDTILLLDTHPENKMALEFYNVTRKKLVEATADYEEQFGPMTADDVDIEKGWQWICKPWPWEMEG